MRKFIIVILTVAALSISLHAQIANDNYTNATLIPLKPVGFGNQINGNLLFSTPSFTAGNTCGNAYSNDLWYKFVAISDQLHLTYNGSQYFIVYRIQNGLPFQLSCSQQTTEVITGQTYYLRVLQGSTTFPDFYFKMEYIVPPDPSTYEDNDECVDAITAVVGIGSCGPTYTFNSDSITVSNLPSTCNAGAKDIWYTVIAPPSGTIELTEISGNIIYVTVFNNDCNALVEQSCSSISSFTPYLINLTPAQSYLLNITSGSGTVEFCLSEGPPPYSNDDCVTGTTLNITSICSDTIDLDLALASSSNEMICGVDSPDIWYNFIAPATGNIIINNAGSFAFRSSLYEGNCNALTSHTCSRFTSVSADFTNLTPGNTYHLRITKSASSTDISFCYQTIANPANNDCSGALPLTVYSGTCGALETLDLAGSTFSGVTPPCFSDIIKDLWYTFTPSTTSISFSGLSGYKSIYTGSCGSLTPITCVNGDNINGLSTGQTYYLQLSSVSYLPEDFCLLEYIAPTESNQVCSSATSLSNGSLITVNSDAAFFENLNSTTCTFNPHDLWFSFTSPASDYVKITNVADSEIQFVLYEGSCGSLTELDCFDFDNLANIILDDLNPNAQHFLQFYQEFHNTNIQKTFTLDFVTPLVNDNCAGATSTSAGISCSDTPIDFTNATLSNVPFPSCINLSNNTWTDLWYNVNVGATGVLELKNRSFGASELDKLYGALYNLDCNALVEVACIGGAGLDYNQSYLFTGLSPNGNYYLRLLTKDKDNGEFCLIVSNVIFPENNDCSGALPLSIGEGQCLGNTEVSFGNATSSGVTASCSSFSNDLWYELETDESGDYLFQKQSSSASLISTLFSGSCGSLTEIYCKEVIGYGNHLFESLTANTTYYLRLSGSSASFCIHRVLEESTESMCTSAIPILESIDETCANSLSGTTIAATSSIGQFCGSTSAGAVFYAFTPSQSTYYTMVLSNAAATHKIALFYNCTLTAPLSCAQDQISPLLIANQTYIVAVFPTISGLTSTFDLCIHSAANLSTENVGISLNNPQTKLDVNGGIKPGNSNVTLPGNIRWFGDLEVYNGSEWKSLTEWDHDAQQNIDMNGLRIRNLNAPSLDTDAANKAYVDAHQDADSSPSNEIQTLSKSGNTISLSGGGSVTDANTTYSGTDFVVSNQTCPAGQVIVGFTNLGTLICGMDNVNDGDNNDTNEIQTISKSGNTVTLSNGGGSFMDAVDDADNSITNEIQTISKSGNIVTLSNGGGSFTDAVDDADNSVTNEIQTLTKSGSTITLSGGGSVSDANTTYSGNNFVLSNQTCPAGQVVIGFTSAGIRICGMDAVNDADNSITNEIQTISKSGNTVTLSNGGGSFSDAVDDADNNISNELITSVSRTGTDLTISEAGDDYTISLDTFSNIFINDGGTIKYPTSNSHDFVFGHTELPSSGTTTENLFFFDESKGAFRAGSLSSSNKWNTSNLGTASFASGHDTEASGLYATALGSNTIANGDFSTALGSFTVASGNYALAGGSSSTASGSNSVALGNNATATQATSISLGHQTMASGSYAMATGRNTKAESSNTFVLGRYNIGGGSPSTWTGTDPLFEVGNGSDGANLNNAMTILKNGNVGIGESSPGNILIVKGDGGSTTPQLDLKETENGDGARLTMTHSNSTKRWTLYGLSDDTDFTSRFNVFYSGYGNIMQLTGVGDVGIGGLPGSNLHIYHGENVGRDGLKLESTGANTNWMRFYIQNSTGNLLLFSKLHGGTSIGNFNDDTGAYSSTSDGRLKNKLSDLHFEWGSFMKLRPLTYQYKSASDGRRYIGMIAQEVLDIYPEMITYLKEDDVYQMDYSGFGVIAIKAIQELKKENADQADLIELQKQKLQEFENRFEVLEAKINGMANDHPK